MWTSPEEARALSVPIEPHERWQLTREALDRLLRRLGDDSETAAREYDAVRRKLCTYFRLRGAAHAEDLADEVIDRLARKLEEGERVENVRSYAYGVARLVLLEWNKSRTRADAALREVVPAAPDLRPAELTADRLACLRRCLRKVPPDGRTLIIDYYTKPSRGDGRKRLAARLGIGYGSLKTRAYRVRNQLEECLKECLAERGGA